jgi:hypothetical protein
MLRLHVHHHHYFYYLISEIVIIIIIAIFYYYFKCLVWLLTYKCGIRLLAQTGSFLFPTSSKQAVWRSPSQIFSGK